MTTSSNADENLTNLCEAVFRDTDLEVGVLTSLHAEEQIERPAGRDVPRCGERF